ncbi:glycosyltransferase family 2 protein [Halosquirtibacter xylanolyticus]|uniref:glycosyltransferase family 2 protein n=1 Tax=Halosquirtibacter xylanolyticus TaxID=3374599 RepID=UPI003749F7F6|nr:glycosyltransferase family 2 protein [Prolixibacteraceae bacterium]
MTLNVSVVVPLYNEDESLKELDQWIKKVMTDHQFTYEVIYVNDGSSDKSWQVIETLAKNNDAVRGICFSRNYGKSAALFAGFEMAEGQVVITMDADLQDSPEEIPELRSMIVDQGYDLVSGWKQKRYDPISKTVPSKLFNGVASWLSGIKLHDFNCGLKAYKKDVVKSIEVYGEMHRYIPILAKEAGFMNIGEKVVQHQARKYGVTKFGLNRFINGFLDLLSIHFMTKFGKKPMHFFGALGSFMFFIGVLSALWVGGSKLWYVFQGIEAERVTESPYFYLSLVSMVLGTQLFLTGFIGELVSRSSTERNAYKVSKVISKS